MERDNYFPGWQKMPGEIDDDYSTVSSDGPIILRVDDKLIKYQISPEGSTFSISRVEIDNDDTLYGYVDATKDTFQFRLKDRLEIPPSQYSLPKKMLITSDIEGNFKGFKSILIGNRVIDPRFNWTFGDNHLVLVGDFFDRGVNVTECLWLIYKLEYEATRQGGMVHFLLGNHDILNLTGYYRHVRDKYQENAAALDLDYPYWYSQKSVLGRWLRTKNVVEKIGAYLFVHAGIRHDFPKTCSLEEINTRTRASIDKDFPGEGQWLDDFIGEESPIWYRGIARELESQTEVEETLSHYEANNMIIGHTVFDEIQYLYDKKVIAIDLEHEENTEKGEMYALWYEEDNFYVVDQDGVKMELS